MLTLPKKYSTLIAAFAPVFTQRLWSHIQVLVVGGILAPGQRTVTAVLRVMGLSDHVHFQNCHRVLDRAVWSSLMLLTPIPWAKRVWALPSMTVLAPSECYCEHSPRAHTRLMDWARRVLLLIRRWLPQRKLVVWDSIPWRPCWPITPLRSANCPSLRQQGTASRRLLSRMHWR
jgi:hypothetical protein